MREKRISSFFIQLFKNLLTEIFIGVRWVKYVDNPNDGYIGKGLTTVPLVAYTATDKLHTRRSGFTLDILKIEDGEKDELFLFRLEAKGCAVGFRRVLTMLLHTFYG